MNATLIRFAINHAQSLRAHENEMYEEQGEKRPKKKKEESI